MHRLVTRRELMAAALRGATGLAIPAAVGVRLRGQQGSRMPLLCVHSQSLAGIGYAELGEIASQMGFDGVDLTVRKGGHVDPDMIRVDWVRAMESIQGVGLSAPIVTTAYTSPLDPSVFSILYLAGRSDVRVIRTAEWPAAPPMLAPRAAQELMTLSGNANHRQLSIAVPFAPEISLPRVWINHIPQAWCGWSFNPGDFGPHWEPALRTALPRLKAVVLEDSREVASQGKETARKPDRCPIGEGQVDFPAFFRILAEAGFGGPISITGGPKGTDNIRALTRDLESARKQMTAAYRAVAVMPKRASAYRVPED